MWSRRTLHECANELEQISNRFRAAYPGRDRTATNEQAKEMRLTSIEGVELLRILALTIRSEQDIGLIPRDHSVVGAVKSPSSPTEIDSLLQSYRPPYTLMQDAAPLSLRDGLNKIAHVNGAKTGFAIDATAHDLLLSGMNQGTSWFAVLSIPDLCRAVKALPDRTVPD